MASPGFSSCSRCNRPLAVDAASDVCLVCLRTGATPDTTAASEEAPPEEAPPEAKPGTQSAPPPQFSPGEHPFAAQFQTTQSDANRTATPNPLGDTAGFVVDESEYLPEPPPGYELIRRVGSGGMGTVYLASELATERTVAIKFLHSPTSGTAFDRFLVEVRALAELKHENIINVLDVKTTWREPYFTMDFASGGTLSNLTKPGQLPTPVEAARLMKAAAEAIAAAHAKSILHRDLKPSNILLFADPARPNSFVPKVSDFGLAKRTDRDDDLTRTGPLGTPCYMSPEAASGRSRELTCATDIYGLGATLFHLLTGRPPFSGESNDDIIRKVIHDEPPRLRSIRPEIPADLEAIVLKALEKSPADRYSSAAAFADDLGRFLSGDSPTARVHSRRRRAMRWLTRNRKRIGLAVGVALVAVGLVAMGRKLTPDPEPPPIPPDPSVQHLAEMKRDLAEGRPAVCLGDKGCPLYSRWQLGSATFGKYSDGDGCYYETIGLGLLELMDNPGIDRYRIHLEIRQVERNTAPAGGPPVPGELDCGLYFGHGFAPGLQGFGADCFLNVTFHDIDPNAVHTGKITPQPLMFERTALIHRPPQAVFREHARVTSRDFTPAAVRPGPWRAIEVEVEPQEVRVFWKPLENQPLEPVKHAQKKPFVPEKMFEAIQASINGKKDFVNKGIVVPKWSPRSALGVYTIGCAVTIKNVVITPLPVTKE